MASFSETSCAPHVSTIRSNDTCNYGNFNSQWKSLSTQRCTSPQRTVTTNSQFPSRSSSSFCPLNDGKHPLFQCTLFKNKSPRERYIVVQKLNYCFNCNHRVTQCPSQLSCEFPNCNERHNTLLHGSRPSIPSAQRSINVSVDSTTTTEQVLATQGEPNTTVLLQILPITIHNNDRHVTTSAFLDQGSTCSILSKYMAGALKIPLRNPKEMTLRGINTAYSQYVHEADLEIADSSSSLEISLEKSSRYGELSDSTTKRKSLSRFCFLQTPEWH